MRTTGSEQLRLIELPPPGRSASRRPPPARSAESAARQRARMSMTARCCNELLAELDRVAQRQKERELLQQDRVERLASLYEAAVRNHEERAVGHADGAPAERAAGGGLR